MKEYFETKKDKLQKFKANMIFMKSEKEIREKLKQIEDSIELEEKYEVRAPMVGFACKVNNLPVNSIFCP